MPEMVKKYEMAGGSIMNVVHYAGIKAVERLSRKRDLKNDSYESTAQDEKLIFFVSDVLDGIKRELTKEGKPFAQ
jgi:hypothetical protein